MGSSAVAQRLYTPRTKISAAKTKNDNIKVKDTSHRSLERTGVKEAKHKNYAHSSLPRKLPESIPTKISEIIPTKNKIEKTDSGNYSMHELEPPVSFVSFVGDNTIETRKQRLIRGHSDTDDLNNQDIR